MKNKLYESGLGDALVDDALYPEEVKHYLVQERLEIKNKLRNYKTLVEVGCMETRHLDQAIEANINYIGIDIVQRYIDDANRNNRDIQGWGEKHHAICYDALKLNVGFDTHAVLKEMDKSSTILVFPFNSFGNIDDCETMLKVLNKLGIDFMLNSYKTDAETTVFRKNYYEENSMTDIEVVESEDAVIIKSGEELNSKCFTNQFFQKYLDKVSFNYFGQFGKSIIGDGK